MTQEERLERNLQEAEKKGNVIVMLDSDEEDNKAPPKAAAAKKSSAEHSHVKLELVSKKRDIPETPLETPGPSLKQALGLDGEGDEPLISLRITTKRTRIETVVDPDGQGDWSLISLKKTKKRTLFGDASGQGDKRLLDIISDIHPKPTNDAPAVKNSTLNPTSRRPASVTPFTPEVSMQDTIVPSSPQEAGADENHSLKNREAGIKQLLRRFELSEYEDKFMESGYDSVGWLYELAEDADLMEKLAVAVGFKPGHAIRFQCKLLKEAKDKSTAQTL